MKIVIELDGGSNNGNPRIDPLGETFRGRHLRSNLSPSTRFSAHSQSMPAIVPGFYVEIDLTAKEVTVYDPLTRPQFKADRKALEHFLSHPLDEQVRKQKFTPLEDKVIPLTDNEIAMEWLLWAYKVTRSGKNDVPLAILHSGDFPQSVVDYARAEQRRHAAMRGGGKTKVPELLGA
jgi:hypothetical protein